MHCELQPQPNPREKQMADLEASRQSFEAHHPPLSHIEGTWEKVRVDRVWLRDSSSAVLGTTSATGEAEMRGRARVRRERERRVRLNIV